MKHSGRRVAIVIHLRLSMAIAAAASCFAIASSTAHAQELPIVVIQVPAPPLPSRARVAFQADDDAHVGMELARVDRRRRRVEGADFTGVTPCAFDVEPGEYEVRFGNERAQLGYATLTRGNQRIRLPRPAHSRATRTAYFASGAVALPMGLIAASVGALLNICWANCGPSRDRPGDILVYGGLTIAVSGLIALLAGAATTTNSERLTPRPRRPLRILLPSLSFNRSSAIASVAIGF